METGQLQDKNYTIDLQTLSNVKYSTPQFNKLEDFLLTELIYHGDTTTLFSGSFLGEPALVEVCTRIPFRVVCREIDILSDLKATDGIIKVKGCTRNPSIGVVTLALEPFDFRQWWHPIKINDAFRLFRDLLRIVTELHAKNYFHGWICRSSVFVAEDLSHVTLGFFHAAAKVGKPAPIVFRRLGPIGERRADDPRQEDVYDAALWFLSFLDGEPLRVLYEIHSTDLPPPLIALIESMGSSDPMNRPPAHQCLEALNGIEFPEG